MKRFEEVEHSADVSLRAHGGSLEELFGNAAYGMFSLMVDLESLAATAERRVLAQARDLEALLVNWLNELLFLHEMNREAYKEFEVSRFSPTGIEAKVRGGGIDKVALKIKAVTFCNLRIEKTNHGYMATLVFDT